MPLLADPWFEAEFLANADPDNKGWRRQGPSIDGAQGLFMCCPCKAGHAIIVPFANPRNAPLVPPGFGMRQRGWQQILAQTGVEPPRPRWTMSGTGLEDLTITPSIDVGDPSCWHGFITNGQVT